MCYIQCDSPSTIECVLCIQKLSTFCYKEIVMIFMDLRLFYNFLTNISQFSEPKECFILKMVIPTIVLLMFMMVLCGNGPN
jgi:hypothetical protein